MIAALLAAFGGWAWVKGNEHGTEKLTNYIGQQAVATLKLTMARAIIVHDVQIKYVDRIKTIEVAGATIEKEVVRYVTQADDAACVVPVGFVREYDAAWTGTPAGSPDESDRGPSGVPLSEVAATDAGNATSCLVYKAQRDGLIEFYRALQAEDRATSR